MFAIDTSTEFGARALDRLQKEHIAWFSTVDGKGTPQPVPVWFLWEGDSVLIYSQPDTGKLRNLARGDRASLHLNPDAAGNDVVVLTGAAAVDDGAPAATFNPAYITKYHVGIVEIGMTDESFAASYSVPIRFVPEKLRGF